MSRQAIDREGGEAVEGSENVEGDDIVEGGESLEHRMNTQSQKSSTTDNQHSSDMMVAEEGAQLVITNSQTGEPNDDNPEKASANEDVEAMVEPDSTPGVDNVMSAPKSLSDDCEYYLSKYASQPQDQKQSKYSKTNFASRDNRHFSACSSSMRKPTSPCYNLSPHGPSPSAMYKDLPSDPCGFKTSPPFNSRVLSSSYIPPATRQNPNPAPHAQTSNPWGSTPRSPTVPYSRSNLQRQSCDPYSFDHFSPPGVNPCERWQSTPTSNYSCTPCVCPPPRSPTRAEKVGSVTGRQHFDPLSRACTAGSGSYKSLPPNLCEPSPNHLPWTSGSTPYSGRHISCAKDYSLDQPWRSGRLQASTLESHCRGVVTRCSPPSNRLICPPTRPDDAPGGPTQDRDEVDAPASALDSSPLQAPSQEPPTSVAPDDPDQSPIVPPSGLAPSEKQQEQQRQERQLSSSQLASQEPALQEPLLKEQLPSAPQSQIPPEPLSTTQPPIPPQQQPPSEEEPPTSQQQVPFSAAQQQPPLPPVEQQPPSELQPPSSPEVADQQEGLTTNTIITTNTTTNNNNTTISTTNSTATTAVLSQATYHGQCARYMRIPSLGLGCSSWQNLSLPSPLTSSTSALSSRLVNCRRRPEPGPGVNQLCARYNRLSPGFSEPQSRALRVIMADEVKYSGKGIQSKRCPRQIRNLFC